MATKKCIPAEVSEAQRLVYGPVAEAQALIELSGRADDSESIATLAVPILERFVEAFENYEHQLAKHGRPPIEKCFPLSGVLVGELQ